MKKRMIQYLKFLEETKASQALMADFELSEMNIQIQFFQHERFIHLIVTLFIAFIAFLSVLYITLFPTIPLLFITILFLILLAFYVRHYYFLENKIQELYGIYDEIRSMKKN